MVHNFSDTETLWDYPIEKSAYELDETNLNTTDASFIFYLGNLKFLERTLVDYPTPDSRNSLLSPNEISDLIFSS